MIGRIRLLRSGSRCPELEAEGSLVGRIAGNSNRSEQQEGEGERGEKDKDDDCDGRTLDRKSLKKAVTHLSCSHLFCCGSSTSWLVVSICTVFRKLGPVVPTIAQVASSPFYTSSLVRPHSCSTETPLASDFPVTTTP